MSEYYKKTWENNVSKQLEKQRKMILDFQSRYQGALERIEQLTMDVSRLKVRNDKYREALEFYADEQNWFWDGADNSEVCSSDWDKDLEGLTFGGRRAREALKGGE